MNTQTLVAVYDTAAHAEAAVRDLRAANVPVEAIKQHAKNGAMSGSRTTSTPTQQQGFWASLFGAEPDHDTTVYDRSIESGSTVVTVKADLDRYDRVSAILEKHNPIDLDERVAQYGSSETRTTRTTTAPAMGARGTATAATDRGTIQLAADSLSVGKRAVSGGTTRIRKYVVEIPVQEQVSLHGEKVTIQRHPVNDGRPVGNASFADETIEMTETKEEAVVSKTAHVTEEIGLRKEASDRVETVKDTVRREEAKVEKVPGGKTEGTRTSGTSSTKPPRPDQRG
jgi:uncharacterized protein (TIGR02271 family)